MKSFSVRLLRRKPVKGTLTYDIAVLDSTKRHHGYRYATLGFYVRSDVARLFGINLYSLSKWLYRGASVTSRIKKFVSLLASYYIVDVKELSVRSSLDLTLRIGLYFSVCWFSFV